MKTMSIWVASATLFLASMGICSCSMGSTTSSEMRGSLEFTQDDLREKPFKAIDVDMVASVYYTQNDGDECSVRLDYSAIKDAEFVQKLKEKIKVVYRDGKDKGKEGKVLHVDKKNGTVVVEGVNKVFKHSKPSMANQAGGIIEMEEPMDL